MIDEGHFISDHETASKFVLLLYFSHNCARTNYIFPREGNKNISLVNSRVLNATIRLSLSISISLPLPSNAIQDRPTSYPTHIRFFTALNRLT